MKKDVICRTAVVWLTVFPHLFCLGISLAWSDERSARSQPPTVNAPDWPEATQARNAEMKRRVDLWLATGEAARMPLHVVYLSCSDQQPFEGHLQRIDRVLAEIQEWFAVQHEAAGFGRTTFALQRDGDQRVKLHEGKLPFTVASRAKGNIRETHAACNKVAKLLLSQSGIDYDHSFVLVLTTIPDDHGAAPFFGVILQDRGYCFAVDTPWLDLNYTQADGPVVWKGKRIGAANSALIGGMAHELGHGFGLPHNDEPASEKQYGESLMASGNYTWREELRGAGRGSFLLSSDAMLLIARPPFAASSRDWDKQPTSSVAEFQMTRLGQGGVRLSGRVVSDVPVHGVRLFDDPPGNSDYNEIAHLALPEEETGAFAIEFAPLSVVGVHDLRLVLCHVNGRWTQLSTKMTVDAEGQADLSQANRDLGKR